MTLFASSPSRRSIENAASNMKVFVEDIKKVRPEAKVDYSRDTAGDKRFTHTFYSFVLLVDGIEYAIDMAGVKLDKLRWTKQTSVHVWDLQRLYLNGRLANWGMHLSLIVRENQNRTIVSHPDVTMGAMNTVTIETTVSLEDAREWLNSPSEETALGNLITEIVVAGLDAIGPGILKTGDIIVLETEDGALIEHKVLDVENDLVVMSYRNKKSRLETKVRHIDRLQHYTKAKDDIVFHKPSPDISTVVRNGGDLSGDSLQEPYDAMESDKVLRGPQPMPGGWALNYEATDRIVVKEQGIVPVIHRQR